MRSESQGPLKILVTGSRGKSSLVRLIHSALLANGIKAYGRITGVIPRELTPGGEVQILRTNGGHVEEMKWWLSSIPHDAEAVIMENSAVAPELQHLAAEWFCPRVTVVTNVNPDHQEAWGPSEEDAIRAITMGITGESAVLLGLGLDQKALLMEIIRSKVCSLQSATFSREEQPKDFRENNLITALDLCRFLGMDPSVSEKAMRRTPPDMADFRLLSMGGIELAFAFSANDIHSTRDLFSSLQWSYDETIILYNHRGDRPVRLKSYRDWILRNKWSSICITGDRPWSPWAWKYYRECRDLDEFLPGLGEGEKVFGCGNVAGLPLKLILERGS